jgi:hypothetical protein
MCEIALADHDNPEKELEYKRWMRAAKGRRGEEAARDIRAKN